MSPTLLLGMHLPLAADIGLFAWDHRRLNDLGAGSKSTVFVCMSGSLYLFHSLPLLPRRTRFFATTATQTRDSFEFVVGRNSGLR
ncbi:hypothetical protein ARMGADRAFT_696817 [Armillaria gallica]|uniref:Uncharacterized protein n=1 Tax=Armillaria gallica TaxID=47427 RepID=A0A2H3E001_ARMGA|nr:hypothetical protein ARMGADRAFT_696817 [Armillaria gallica]